MCVFVSLCGCVCVCARVRYFVSVRSCYYARACVFVPNVTNLVMQSP